MTIEQADASPAVLAAISAEPIVAEEVDAFVRATANGAVVTFAGVVRDHDGGRTVTALEYQAHPDAADFLAACCRDVAAATGLRVAAIHRTGMLAIGDTALLAAVAAPHRREAFAACAELIELVKSRVPIWKRQRFDDGASEWVGL